MLEAIKETGKKTWEKIKAGGRWVKKQTKKILIGLGIVSVVLAAGTALEPTEVELTEVPMVKTQVGERNFNTFIDKEGNKIEVEITKEENRSYGLKGAGQPKYRNYEWDGASGGQAIYEMVTPILNDNEYVLLPEFDGITTTTPTMLIKIPGKAEKIIDNDLIIDNKITEEGLLLLE